MFEPKCAFVDAAGLNIARLREMKDFSFYRPLLALAGYWACGSAGFMI